MIPVFRYTIEEQSRSWRVAGEGRRNKNRRPYGPPRLKDTEDVTKSVPKLFVVVTLTEGLLYIKYLPL